jgi:hypothetical protein
MSIEIIKLSDILVFEQISSKYINIEEHIYFITLDKNNPNMYHNYINILTRQREKKTGNWQGFKELYKNIKKNGFDFKNNESIIIKNINNNYCCLHGRHRICMMKLIHGDNILIVLKNNRVQQIISNK